MPHHEIVVLIETDIVAALRKRRVCSVETRRLPRRETLAEEKSGNITPIYQMERPALLWKLGYRIGMCGWTRNGCNTRAKNQLMTYSNKPGPSSQIDTPAPSSGERCRNQSHLSHFYFALKVSNAKPAGHQTTQKMLGERKRTSR